jgi:colanic acid biosynthesis glycosyl transferase WcaI
VTGLVDETSPTIKAARRLERSAYRAARKIVVLSRAFTDNLVAKGVPEDKIQLIYDPATRAPDSTEVERDAAGLQILSMGNIGHSQGLTNLVRAVDSSDLPDDVRLVITGSGVAADEARAEVRTDRVRMVGVLDDTELETELKRANVALVTQRYEGGEFNIPSKLMNFMAYGLPVLAAVHPGGEVARIVREAEAGWVVDSSDPDSLPREIARLREAKDEIAERAAASRAFAERHFSQDAFAKHFDVLLRELASGTAAS